MRNLRRGFTLVEILIVTAILMVLMALLISTLGNYLIKAKNVSTSATLDSVVRALEHYKFVENGTYPIKPGGNDMSSGKAPDFYQTPCAPFGSPSDGTEDNSALINLLTTRGYLPLKPSNLVNGRLVDDFGSPVIIRFMVVDTGTERRVRVVVWSYGHDRKNGINATTNFTCAAPPGDDKAELLNISNSAANNPDDLHIP
jgi:prepilin-type N-terminal cleavage/methylation domain-containing protein